MSDHFRSNPGLCDQLHAEAGSFTRGREQRAGELGLRAHAGKESLVAKSIAETRGVDSNDRPVVEQEEHGGGSPVPDRQRAREATVQSVNQDVNERRIRERPLRVRRARDERVRVVVGLRQARGRWKR